MLFEKNDLIVFAGDSVTDMGCGGPAAEENLGNSYVREIANLFRATYPDYRMRIVNSGISGNTSRDLLARFERDVTSLNPQWVSFCIGINDVWRQYDRPFTPSIYVMPEEYEKNMRTMIERLKPTVKGIFILPPYMMDSDNTAPMHRRMEEYAAICRRLAEEYGCRYVDIQKAFYRYFDNLDPYMLSADRIHPNLLGATVIARAFLNEVGFDFAREI